jgi:hypothetical protein
MVIQIANYMQKLAVPPVVVGTSVQTPPFGGHGSSVPHHAMHVPLPLIPRHAVCGPQVNTEESGLQGDPADEDPAVLQAKVLPTGEQVCSAEQSYFTLQGAGSEPGLEPELEPQAARVHKTGTPSNSRILLMVPCSRWLSSGWIDVRLRDLLFRSMMCLRTPPLNRWPSCRMSCRVYLDYGLSLHPYFLRDGLRVLNALAPGHEEHAGPDCRASPMPKPHAIGSMPDTMGRRPLCSSMTCSASKVVLHLEGADRLDFQPFNLSDAQALKPSASSPLRKHPLDLLSDEADLQARCIVVLLLLARSTRRSRPVVWGNCPRARVLSS